MHIVGRIKLTKSAEISVKQKSNFEIQHQGSQPNILNLLDFCKGLAIIWIFLVHYPFKFEVGWFGWQGVHIFIVLSSFGLTYSCLKKNEVFSWKQWYLRRAERILPAYWLVAFVGFLLMVCICVFRHIVHNSALITCLLNSSAKLLLNLLLLRDLFVKTMMSEPTPPLWFIPFVVSFYLVFPWLYTQLVKHRTAKAYILVLLGAAAIEFIYRAISIYWLDSLPIGYSFDWPFYWLDRLPNSSVLNVPQQVPFGLFPSRMAEFLLGMIGALILVENPQKVNNIILNFWVGVAGVFIWLIGNVLLYVGLWGWVFADFIIAIGLILWVLNLAFAFQQKFSFLFLWLSRLGIWSYYIYLTHFFFIYLFSIRQDKLTVDDNLLSLIIKVFVVVITIVATGIASWLVMRFDNSKFAKVMVRKSIAVFLKS